MIFRASPLFFWEIEVPEEKPRQVSWMKVERPGFLKSVIEPAGTLGKTNQHVPVTHETRFASIPTRAHKGAWHRVHARLADC
jgi:hypothetical protein